MSGRGPRIQWNRKEDALILQLRDDKLTWKQISEKFSQTDGCYKRSAAALAQRYSRHRKDKQNRKSTKTTAKTERKVQSRPSAAVYMCSQCKQQRARRDGFCQVCWDDFVQSQTNDDDEDDEEASVDSAPQHSLRFVSIHGYFGIMSIYCNSEIVENVEMKILWI